MRATKYTEIGMTYGEWNKKKKETEGIPVIAQLYYDAMSTAMEIKRKKMHDYNTGEVDREDYYLLGDWTLIDEIWKKMLRILAIETSGEKPTCEQLEDTLLDMMNYCADFHAYLKIKEMRSKKE